MTGTGSGAVATSATAPATGTFCGARSTSPGSWSPSPAVLDACEVLRQLLDATDSLHGTSSRFDRRPRSSSAGGAVARESSCVEHAPTPERAAS